MKKPISVFWFRRDLRWQDNAGLYYALYQAKLEGHQVLPLFVFDKNILAQSSDKADRRVDFIHQTLTRLQKELIAKGKSFWVQYGTPLEVFEKLFTEFKVASIYTNHDYGPKANARDASIEALAKKKGASFHHYKDQVIFEKEEVVKDDGKPYTVFTPYANKWKLVWMQKIPKKFPSEKLLDYFLDTKPFALPSLKEIGFEKTDLVIPPMHYDTNLVKKYTTQRDFPALNATSRLSVHLRFGTISARSLALETKNLNATFFNELIWRDFYHMILWHFPQVAEGKSFKPKYDFIQWRNNEKEFEAWCEGKTGYPIVDAGMRELNTTGFMHNRVRMIVASFLTKHLLIDWR